MGIFKKIKNIICTKASDYDDGKNPPGYVKKCKKEDCVNWKDRYKKCKFGCEGYKEDEIKAMKEEWFGCWHPINFQRNFL